MSLVTLAELKEYAGISSSDSDDLLTKLIDQVGNFVTLYTGQLFEPETKNDKLLSYSGNGVIPLRFMPVSSITAVTIGVSAQGLSDIDVEESTGMLHIGLRGAAMTTRIENDDVYITYVAGYSSVPDAIRLVVNEMVTSIFNNIGEIGAKSSKMGDYSFSRFANFSESGIDPSLKAILDQFKIID